ncbi:MAG: AMP-binding protein, partial [Actinomycetales bacterium]
MLKEFSVPAIVPAPTTGSLSDHIVENAQNDPGSVVIAINRGGAWVDMTAAEFLGEVKAVAKGLIANDIEPGQRIAIMSRTRYEWTLLDYATWYAGAISVPIYETSSAEQVHWICSDSNAVAIVLESAKNKATYAEVSTELPEVTRAWVIEEGCIDQLKAAGRQITDEELESHRASVTPETLATIIYTSGTTGRPKGCMLTHRNFMFEVDNVVQGLDEVFLAPGSST